ncbi:hypothetical protein RJT34_27431 [Clitoria ternatea]|uniref:Uncharacterized protein n=1 Tax=Clitoria ternatea TaxID=43366 RepID=A0AAN9F867_CLITE
MLEKLAMKMEYQILVLLSPPFFFPTRTAVPGHFSSNACRHLRRSLRSSLSVDAYEFKLKHFVYLHQV